MEELVWHAAAAADVRQLEGLARGQRAVALVGAKLAEAVEVEGVPVWEDRLL